MSNNANVVPMQNQATAIHTNLEPTNMRELIDYAKLIANSKLVPPSFEGKPENIIVAVQLGTSIGLSVGQSLQHIAIINGKPSIYGDMLLALCTRSHLCEWVKEEIKGDKKEEWVATCTVKRKNYPQVVITFSWQDAVNAQIIAKATKPNKDGWVNKSAPWLAYPKRMLQMRARGFALRDAFPDLLNGFITAEEAQDYPTQQNDQSIIHLEAQPVITTPAIENKENTKSHQRNTDNMSIDERIERTITSIRNKQTKEELDTLSAKWDEAVNSCKLKGKPIPDEKVSLIAQEFNEAYDHFGLSGIIGADIVQEMPHAS